MPAITVASFLVSERDFDGAPYLTFRSRQKTIEVPGGVIWRPNNPISVSNQGYWFVKDSHTEMVVSPSGFNTPPTAVISISQTGVNPYEIMVNALSSIDPDDRIVHFSYDFNDDGIFEDHVSLAGQDIGNIYDNPLANPAWFQFTYGTAGAHSVGVRVTDERGATTEVRTPSFTLTSNRPRCHPELSIFQIPADCFLTSATRAP